MRDAFVRAISRMAARDKRIVLLTADLGYKIFDDFAERFPERFLNMGVAEANMVSVAAGLALEGFRPVTYTIVPFATVRCLEQIRNDICMMHLPVIITGIGGGYSYGPNGPTHHGVDDIGVLRSMAEILIVCPCDPCETEMAVEALLSQDGPAYLRLGRAGEKNLPGTNIPLIPGEPTILRNGSGVALLACGSIASEALDAAEHLSRQGLDPLVLSVHTLKPIGTLYTLIRKANIQHLFTIEEHGPCGGLFEAVSGLFASETEHPLIYPLHTPDSFLECCGSQVQLRKMTGLDSAGIVSTIEQRLGIKT